jgi:hypothetical protein
MEWGGYVGSQPIAVMVITFLLSLEARIGNHHANEKGPSHSLTAAPLHPARGMTGAKFARAGNIRFATNSIAAPIIWDLLFRAKGLLLVVRQTKEAPAIPRRFR